MVRRRGTHVIFIVLLLLQLVVAGTSFVLSGKATDSSTIIVDEKRLVAALNVSGEVNGQDIKKVTQIIKLSVDVEKKLRLFLGDIGVFLRSISFISLIFAVGNIYLWWALLRTSKKPMGSTIEFADDDRQREA